MRRFENKTCVVTGGAVGIGRACADRLAAEGARVAIFDLAGQLDAMKGALTGGEFTGIACDVSVRSDVERAFAQSRSMLGPVDVLVNNAGLGLSKNFLEMDDDTFGRLMSVNVHGVFMAGQVAARQMVDAGRPGAIVNMASVGAFMSGPTLAAYGATKGAVVTMTKGMAVALAPHGIRVNSVAPGTVATDINADLRSDPMLMTGIELRTPLRRMGGTDEIAAAVAYLGSEDASYTTGHCLLVDGGRTALNYVVEGVRPIPEPS